jgi:hypothetical protein
MASGKHRSACTVTLTRFAQMYPRRRFTSRKGSTDVRSIWPGTDLRVCCRPGIRVRRTAIDALVSRHAQAHGTPEALVIA